MTDSLHKVSAAAQLRLQVYPAFAALARSSPLGQDRAGRGGAGAADGAGQGTHVPQLVCYFLVSPLMPHDPSG